MVLAICRLNQPPIDKELCIMISKNVQILKPKYLNFSFFLIIIYSQKYHIFKKVEDMSDA